MNNVGIEAPSLTPNDVQGVMDAIFFREPVNFEDDNANSPILAPELGVPNFAFAPTLATIAAPPAPAKRKRTVICPICKVEGHYQRSCPQYDGVIRPPAARKKIVPPACVTPTLPVPAPLEDDGVNSDAASAQGDESDSDDEARYLDPVVMDAMAALAANERRDGEPITAAPAVPPAVPVPPVAVNLPWHDPSKWVEVPINNTSHHNRSGDVAVSPVPRTHRKYKGAISIPATVEDPLDVFMLLMDPTILAEFVVNTNSFVAQQGRKPAWSADKPLTVEELTAYFGLTLYIGVHQLPDRKMYWSKGRFGCAYVKSVMGRDRFLLIQYNLHWLNATDVTPAERTRRNKVDGFWTVFDHF